jgi:hypothetical protein
MPAFVAFIAAHSQNPPPKSTLLGESKNVLLVPHRTVDAGEVKFKPDSDNDGMPDADETANGTNPDDPSDADADADGDGLSNGDEVAGGSNVNNPDSDGDGVSDGEEARLGFNPNDGSSTPPQNAGTLVSIQISPARLSLSVNSLLGQEPVRLRVTGLMSNTTTTDLTESPDTVYQSLDETVALVDGLGNVAGLSEGSTFIKVTNGAITAQAPVSVSSFNPGGVSSVSLPGTAYAVAVSGDYAYVAAGSAGLQIVDMSDKQSPAVVGSLDTPGTAKDVRVAGGVAYVADGSGGLRLINVSNPSSPSLLGSADTQGDAQDLVVNGGRVYVAAGNAGLKVVDVSSPSAPSVVGTLATEVPAQGVDVSGGLALVVGGPGGNNSQFVVIDVSNPAAPQQLGSVPTQRTSADLFVRDRLAYIANSNGGMMVVDFTTPSNPRIGSSDFFINRADVAAYGHYAFFSADPLTFGVPIYDLADPTSPQYAGTLDFAPQDNYKGAGIAMDDQYVYQAANLDDFGGGGSSSFGPGDPTARLFIGRYRVQTPEAADTAGIAPTITLLEPSDGQDVVEGSQLHVAASAADDVRVSDVKFSVNGVTVATDYVAPYEFTFWLPVSAGPMDIVATATDSAGNSKSTATTTVNVGEDPPPTIDITLPEPGSQLTAGLFQRIYADYNDNGYVTSVEFFVNGVKAENTQSGDLGFDVPLNLSAVTIEAVATDNIGKKGFARRTYSVVPYDGPTATLTGRVLDGRPDIPAPGLTVSAFNVFTTQTGPDGTFTLPGIPTVRTDLTANVTGEFNGRKITRSLPGQYYQIPEGDLDMGTLILTRRSFVENFGAPRVAATGGVTGVVNGADLFVGYELYNALYWPGGFDNADGAFVTGKLIGWSEPALPYGGVRSADVSVGHIIAQMNDAPGFVNDFSYYYPPPRFRRTPLIVQLETGLSAECDYIAADYDTTGNFRRVLVFDAPTDAGTPQESTAVTVRISDDNEGYSPPVSLPVEPGARLRTPRLLDVNGDRLQDLLLIRQVSDTEARVVLYPRVSENEFGAPVESPITTRSTPAAWPAYDYAAAVLEGSGAGGIAVLGDDRVRLYTVAPDGAFSLTREFTFPAGVVPVAVAAGSYYKDNFNNIAGSLIVSTISTETPETGAVYVYMNGGNGFRPPRVFGYTVSPGMGAEHARVLLTNLNGYGDSEVLIMDGERMTTLYDIIPIYDVDSTGGGPGGGGGGPVDLRGGGPPSQ